MQSFRNTSKLSLDYVIQHPAITLGAAGAVVAVSSWLAVDHYKDAIAKPATGATQADMKANTDRLGYAQTAKTVGWTLLGAAAIMGGIQMLREKSL